MPLGTLDRTPPPFFKQGPSAFSKLIFFSAFALFLMVADVRFRLMAPLRVAMAGVLYPVQWAVRQPLQWAAGGGAYLESLHSALQAQTVLEKKLVLQSQRAGQVEQLALENTRLRQLLVLRQTSTTPAQAAEVLYDAADPYTRKVVIDKGLLQGIESGSPVLDESGVLGQVTRAYPLVSEVTLVIDRDHAIPVLNARTGARSVAYGDPTALGGALELRFMAGNADVLVGDLLTTSGVDGTYPPGLPVAKVLKVERRADSAFARIYCAPQAQVYATKHVMVLKPLGPQIAPRPAPEPVATPGKKATSK
jgi:rod shape-determining protein MreC